MCGKLCVLSVLISFSNSNLGAFSLFDSSTKDTILLADGQPSFLCPPQAAESPFHMKSQQRWSSCCTCHRSKRTCLFLFTSWNVFSVNTASPIKIMQHFLACLLLPHSCQPPSHPTHIFLSFFSLYPCSLVIPSIAFSA